MKINVKLLELSDKVIATCPELDINCYGDDKEEAFRRLMNVLQFYIDSAEEYGLDVENIKDIAIENGWDHLPTSAHNLPPTKSIN